MLSLLLTSKIVQAPGQSALVVDCLQCLSIQDVFEVSNVGKKIAPRGCCQLQCTLVSAITAQDKKLLAFAPRVSPLAPLACKQVSKQASHPKQVQELRMQASGA